MFVFQQHSEPAHLARNTVRLLRSKTPKPWFHMLVFYFDMEARLKWNKIILAAITTVFHFRRDSILK